jgi:hypothetical protein
MRHTVMLALLIQSIPSATFAAAPPDFNADVLPVFRKYCLGCHNAKEAEGGLVLEDHARTMEGSGEGEIVVAGKSDESKLWQVLAGQRPPQMPPKDQPAPKADEIAIIAAWIDAGAKPPSKGPIGLITPKIAPRGHVREPITALAADPTGRWLAVGGRRKGEGGREDADGPLRRDRRRFLLC